MLRGSLTRTWVTVRFDEDVPAMAGGEQWVFSNSISVSTGRSRLGSVRAEDWLRDLIVHLATDPRVLWGGAWDRDEFAASNLHDDSDGMWALGRDCDVRCLDCTGSTSLARRTWTSLVGAASHRRPAE